jgi:hypothetical protein
VSRISVGGILGYIKSKFTPTLKRSERIDRFWKHKETGVTIEVTKYEIAVGPDVQGKFVRFLDRNVGPQTLSMPEPDFRKMYYSIGNSFRS